MDGDTIEWGGEKAWFLDHHDLIRRRDENERAGADEISSDGAPSDSYYEWDYEQWENRQGEMKELVSLETELPPLPVIVEVEMADDR